MLHFIFTEVPVYHVPHASKCIRCKSPVVLCPSEQQLKKHMKSAHSDYHATTARKHSKRVCRFCLKLLEQEKECSECKSLVKSFANSQEDSNAMSFSSAMSFKLLIGALLVIFIAAILAVFFRP